MYDHLDNKDLALDHFANSVGQEVSGLTTQALKQSKLGEAVDKFKAQNIADRQKVKQAENFTNAIRDLAVDELARQNPGMTETELKQLKQDMADGTVPTPTIKFMEGQKDADGNKVLGAFDAENNAILLDKGLYDQAASGDVDATAKLLGVYLEEQGHAVASVMEQRMGVQDFRFDEGGMVARELLKDFSASGANFGFSLNIAGNTTDFVTSAQAIDNAISTQFTHSRLISDKKNAGNEFSSTDNSFVNGLVSDALEYAGLQQETSIWDVLAEDPSLKNMSDDEKRQILLSVLDGGEASDASYGDYLELSGLKEAAMSKDATALDKLRYHAELALSTKGTVAGDDLAGALLENPEWIGTAINGGKTNGAYGSFMTDVETNFYNQFTQVGNTEARTATFNNGERDVTLDWAADASKLARDSGLTTDQAIRKTGFNTFDTLLRASFAAGDVASIEINGGWRPKHPKTGLVETGSHGTNAAFDALDIRSITFDSEIPSKNKVRMMAYDKNGKVDKTTTDVSGSYDPRVRNFTEKLAERTTGQIISPWAQRQRVKYGLSANNVTSSNPDWQSILMSHRDHLHFSAAE